jgi:hypothetical protein
MTLDLTVEEVNAIMGVLGELPSKSGVFPLILKIQEQAKAQLGAEDKPTE